MAMLTLKEAARRLDEWIIADAISYCSRTSRLKEAMQRLDSCNQALGSRVNKLDNMTISVLGEKTTYGEFKQSIAMLDELRKDFSGFHPAGRRSVGARNRVRVGA